jgi:hypothetical protein
MFTTTTPTPARSAFSWLNVGRAKASGIGIDIGIDRVQISTFVPDPTRAGKSAYRWLTQAEFSLPIDPQQPPQPNWVDIVTSRLYDQLPRCIDGEQCMAVVALPIPWIHYQTAVATELQAAKAQCDAMFSHSIFHSQSHLTAWPIATGKEQVMATAIAETAACEIAEVISQVGYQVQAIMPHGAALLQSATALTSLRLAASLLLEFSGGLIAIRNEDNACGLCRHLPACTVALSDRPDVVEFESWLQQLAFEFDATSRYVSRLTGQRNDRDPVLICGSVASIPGVDVALATMLGRPVAKWRYAGRSRPSRCEDDRRDASFAVSLSLASAAVESIQANRSQSR